MDSYCLMARPLVDRPARPLSEQSHRSSPRSLRPTSARSSRPTSDGNNGISSPPKRESNLRVFSLERRRLPPERSLKEPDPLSLKMLEGDLKGKNGKWKQRKAREEWDRQMKLKEEWEEQLRLQEEARRRRKASELEKLRRLQEAELQKKLEEQERERRLREERARQKAEQDERDRVRREEEERLWRLRQPRTCEKCNGGGDCPACGGKGYFLATYLSPTVTKKSPAFYGRTKRGCEVCGGCKEERSRGEMTRGSGKCFECKGSGKIVPTPAEIKELEKTLHSPSRYHTSTGTSH